MLIFCNFRREDVKMSALKTFRIKQKLAKKGITEKM